MKVHNYGRREMILSELIFPGPGRPSCVITMEWDGKVPRGLKGDALNVTARILSVVDCFDSVREDRPYRRGMTREEASALLQRGAGAHFDPKVVDRFLENLPRFDGEIRALGLDQQSNPDGDCEAVSLSNSEIPHTREQGSVLAYDQIKNAHREVYALYEIARTFGSSLDMEDTLSILVNRVGHIVPFDTCVVYLYDELKGYATSAHVVGKNAEALRDRLRRPARASQDLRSPTVAPSITFIRAWTLRASSLRAVVNIARWLRCRSLKTDCFSARSRFIHTSLTSTRTITCAFLRPSRGSHPTRSPTLCTTPKPNPMRSQTR